MAASMVPNGAAWSEAAISLSWKEVVSDYKAFHGVRARGGTVDDLPEYLKEPVGQADGQETRPDAKLETANGSDANRSLGGGKNDAAAETGVDGERVAGLDMDWPIAAKLSATTAAPKPEADAKCASSSDTNQRSAPGLLPPQTILGSMNGDENLKKLLMSWYYAGYYTGLYEGQQQAAQGQPEVGQPEVDQPGVDQHTENDAQP